jgi:hypothetical protein
MLFLGKSHDSGYFIMMFFNNFLVGNIVVTLSFTESVKDSLPLNPLSFVRGP